MLRELKNIWSISNFHCVILTISPFSQHPESISHTQIRWDMQKNNLHTHHSDKKMWRWYHLVVEHQAVMLLVRRFSIHFLVMSTNYCIFAKQLRQWFKSQPRLNWTPNSDDNWSGMYRNKSALSTGLKYWKSQLGKESVPGILNSNTDGISSGCKLVMTPLHGRFNRCREYIFALLRKELHQANQTRYQSAWVKS